jgi:hypothetical protein
VPVWACAGRHNKAAPASKVAVVRICAIIASPLLKSPRTATR